MCCFAAVCGENKATSVSFLFCQHGIRQLFLFLTDKMGKNVLYLSNFWAFPRFAEEEETGGGGAPPHPQCQRGKVEFREFGPNFGEGGNVGICYSEIKWGSRKYGNGTFYFLKNGMSTFLMFLIFCDCNRKIRIQISDTQFLETFKNVAVSKKSHLKAAAKKRRKS